MLETVVCSTLCCSVVTWTLVVSVMSGCAVVARARFQNQKDCCLGEVGASVVTALCCTVDPLSASPGNVKLSLPRSETVRISVNGKRVDSHFKLQGRSSDVYGYWDGHAIKSDASLGNSNLCCRIQSHILNFKMRDYWSNFQPLNLESHNSSTLSDS
jgi:hypothetical protein